MLFRSMNRENKKFLSFAYGSSIYDPICGEEEWEGSAPHIPVIGGEPFPWLCTDDEMVLRFSHKQIPTLALKFFARNVITSLHVDDLRDGVYCAGGYLISTTKAAGWGGRMPAQESG